MCLEREWQKSLQAEVSSVSATSLMLKSMFGINLITNKTIDVLTHIAVKCRNLIYGTIKIRLWRNRRRDLPLNVVSGASQRRHARDLLPKLIMNSHNLSKKLKHSLLNWIMNTQRPPAFCKSERPTSFCDRSVMVIPITSKRRSVEGCPQPRNPSITAPSRGAPRARAIPFSVDSKPSVSATVVLK